MLPDNYPDQMTPLILEALVGLYAKKWLENNGTLGAYGYCGRAEPVAEPAEL